MKKNLPSPALYADPADYAHSDEQCSYSGEGSDKTNASLPNGVYQFDVDEEMFYRQGC